MLALSPLLHPCHHQHFAGIFASVLLASLPSLPWRLCHRFAGAVAVLASLLLLHWCCLPHHTHIAASIVRGWRCHCCTGIAASIALASLPAFHWCQHPHSLIQHPCRAGVYTIMLLALSPLLPLLHWCCRPCPTCVLPASQGHLCYHSAGVVPLIAPVLPSLLRKRLHRCSAGVDTHIELASKPSICWRCRRHRIVAIVALASSPSLHLRFASIVLASSPLLLRRCWAGVFAIVLLASP